MEKKFHILSIDGGGLKGLIAIRILKIIENILGNRIQGLFNLMGGTSTGGLIVSALTVKNKNDGPMYDLSYIENLYLEVAQTIFKRGEFKLTGKETDEFEDLLHKILGETRIAETLIPICATTYDLVRDEIIVFKTRSGIHNPAKNVKLFDVCRATSAIPPIFPVFPLQYNNRLLNCVDAGYHIKNPSIAVVAEAWKHQSYYSYPGLKEEDIVLLSISTGTHSENEKDWSLDINEVLHGQRIAINYIKKQQLTINPLKIKYMRVDLNLGNGEFSFMKIIEIGKRLEALAQNKDFHRDVLQLFGKF